MEEKKREPWEPIFPEQIDKRRRDPDAPELPYRTWRPKRRKKPKPDAPPKS